MAVHRTACVVLTCDACEEPLGAGAGDGGTWHFGDTVEAYNMARSVDWYAERDRVVCDVCLTIRGCGLLGHQWTPWFGGPVWWSDGRWQRHCLDCGANEWAPGTSREVG